MPSDFIVIKKTIYGVFEASETNMLAKHMIELDESDLANGEHLGHGLLVRKPVLSMKRCCQLGSRANGIKWNELSS